MTVSSFRCRHARARCTLSPRRPIRPKLESYVGRVSSANAEAGDFPSLNFIKFCFDKIGTECNPKTPVNFCNRIPSTSNIGAGSTSLPLPIFFGFPFTAVTFGLLLFNPVRAIVKLIEQHGHRGNMSKWVSNLRGDCPKRNAAQLHERCDLICPNLPKVL